jgi:hypothetical protein
MSKAPIKTYSTIGCCGLDCGLCPRYYTEGKSRCPGCGGTDFYEKHPSCGIITCCVKNKGLEVCGECDEYPCKKFDPKIKEGGEYDSFIIYQNVHKNMTIIKKQGLKKLLKQQEERIKLLESMIKEFDEGRSKNLYCIASTLLPIPDLKSSLEKARQQIKQDKIKSDDLKAKAKVLKAILNEVAEKEGIELKLRKKHG